MHEVISRCDYQQNRPGQSPHRIIDGKLTSVWGLLFCRILFAQLQSGPFTSVDPTPFVKALNLNHAIQQVRPYFVLQSISTCCLASRVILLLDILLCLQDCQEFMKLLLSTLEQRLQPAADMVSPACSLLLANRTGNAGLDPVL